MNVCCVSAIVKNSVFSLGLLKYVVCLCSGCCVFWNLGLIGVCMFIGSKALLISSATVIVRAGRSHLVEPLCYCVVYCV